MRRQEGRSVARRNAECSPRLSGLRSPRLFEARTDEVGLLGGANQQGGDRWMLVAHVSGPLSQAAARAICPNSLRRRCCIRPS